MILKGPHNISKVRISIYQWMKSILYEMTLFHKPEVMDYSSNDIGHTRGCFLISLPWESIMHYLVT